MHRTLTLLLASLLWPPSLWAAQVRLTWNANTESDLAGYKIYYSTSQATLSKTTSPSVTLGLVTATTVTGLTSGTVYYFGATAFDISGNESGFSNIVSKPALSTRCDLNGDGATNALDVQAEANAILAGSTSSTYDINQDSSVNVLDLQRLANAVLGTQPCP